MPSRRPVRRVVSLVASVVMLSVMCVVMGPTVRADDGGPSAADFCTTWNAIHDAQAGGQSGVQVTLSNGTVISANDAALTGTSCTDPTAGIEMNSPILSEAQGGSGGSSGQSATPTLYAGQELLVNLWIDSLTLSWTPTSGITLSGVLHLNFSGGLVNLRFSGSFLNPDNWSVTLSSPPSGTYLPMINSTPVSFSGTLGRTYSGPFFSASASVSMLQFGDVTLENFLFSAYLSGSSAEVEITSDLTAGDIHLFADFTYDNSGGAPTFDINAGIEVSTSPPSILVLNGSLDQDGNLDLLGQADLALGGYNVAGFSLHVSGSPGGPIQVNTSGNLSLVAQNFSVAIAGGFGSNSNGDVSFDLAGAADFKFGYYNIKTGRFSLSGTDTAAQAMVRFNFLAFGFLPINMAAWFNPDGTYKRVHLPFSIFGYILFGGMAKSACKCQVTF